MRPFTTLFARLVVCLPLFLVACGGGGGSEGSSTAVAAPAISTQPASATVSAGSAALFSVAANGGGTLAYQWTFAGAAINGATSSSYSIAATTAANAGSYSVVVSNSAGSVTSSAALLTVNVAAASAPAITAQPASLTVAAGASASFTVTASSTTTVSYQWFKDSVAIASASAATYTIASVAAANAGTYYVVATNSAGATASSTATLTVSTSSSGSNTAAVVAAANAFKATLSTNELATAQLAYTLANARSWTNLPVGSRNGLKLGSMSAAQLAAANTLIGSALGTAGVRLLEQIRLGDEVIHGTNSSQSWGYALYYVALIGTPSTTQPWLLQITGHHLAYNLTYNGSQVSATPLFDGTEPPNWTDASNVAHAPLETQRAAVQALAAAIQADGTLTSAGKLSGTFTDVVMGVGTSGDSNYPLSYPSGSSGRGASVAAMSTAQKALVKAAIEAWVDTQAADVAGTLLAAYESDSALASTYVGYGVGSGGTADFAASPSGLTSQHSYLRIDGPRVWIEFVVQQGVAFTSQVHYHTLWRDKTADYGAEF